jgi:sigma-54 dependent transcriptional regulator, acetoin dehydrogenase operon transcriptional activator AcoR
MRQQPRLLFGTSAAITKVVDQCARFARTRDPIVLLGERGTGKTALAEDIHQLSQRPGEFVEESAAGLPRVDHDSTTDGAGG